MNKDSQEQFYIYTDTGKLLGVKDRNSVHHDGSWHRAVQLNLFHHGDLLMQCRSNKVDIAKGLYDQSLATQLIVEDREDDMSALRRGLFTELHINFDDLHILYVAGPKKISKQYDYDPSLYNQEFTTLYEARLPNKKIHSTNEKVGALFWIPVLKIKQMIKVHPEKFTKTFIMWLQEVM